MRPQLGFSKVTWSLLTNQTVCLSDCVMSICVQVYRTEDAVCLYTLHGHSAAVSALTLHQVRVCCLIDTVRLHLGHSDMLEVLCRPSTVMKHTSFGVKRRVTVACRGVGVFQA